MLSAFFYYPIWDPTYILVVIAAVLSLWASSKVKSTYNKYSHVRSMSGLTGAQVAERILHANGIYDVTIEHVSGNLTDHYDSRNKTLRLSDMVYNSTSVSALGVAAHECGHAIQDNVGYSPLKIRASLVPVANFGAMLSWPLVIFGLIIGGTTSSILIQLGIVLFCAVVLFQLVTLPVEFNASNRAIAMLENNHLLYGDEVTHAKKVLSAAAMTYVASAAGTILQLVRLLIIAGGRRDD